MDISQVASLLDVILASYPSKFRVDDPQKTLNAWEQVLKNHDSETVFRNFEKHLISSPFPPTVADLVKVKSLERMDAIPDARETWEYLKSSNRNSELTEEQLASIQESKSKIKQILGVS